MGLDKGLSSYEITRRGPSFQSATPALNGGVDLDWIASAPRQDIDDIGAPYNHDKCVTAIMRRFV